MSTDHEKLKALILSDEMAQIKALKLLLEDHQKLSTRISQVLDSAVDLTIQDNPEFGKKLSKIDPESYVIAVKNNQATFIEALLPIIGPMIRKSVTSAIRRFVGDINRTIGQRFSAQALKWRWTAFKTGVPVAEIVFKNTIEYQVQQAFLIDNNSGLLIAHAGQEDALLQDKDAMSAMLTAIQDFVKDSIGGDNSGLSAAELGDDLLWIIHGSIANIAVVIKGVPTQRLNDKIITVLERIHLEYNSILKDQNQWHLENEIQPELDELLITQSQSDDENQDKSSNINIWPWLITAIAILAVWAWFAYQKNANFKSIESQLIQTPGFVLLDLSYENNQLTAKGLKDPLVNVDGFKSTVNIVSTPYISLADELVERRVYKVLNDTNLSVKSVNNLVTIYGKVNPKNNLEDQITKIKMLPGVQQLNIQTEEINIPVKTDLNDTQNPAKVNSSTEIPKNTYALSEHNLSHENTQPVNQSELPEVISEVSNTRVLKPDVSGLIEFIENSSLVLSQPDQINPHEFRKLSEITASIVKLSVLDSSRKIKLIAQSDCQGSVDKSNANNATRLTLVKSFMINKGVKTNVISQESKKCLVVKDIIDPQKNGIWFEVVP